MNEWKSLPWKVKLKIIGTIGSIFIFILFVVQNLERVQLDFLFWTFHFRLVFLLIFSVVVGVGIGYIWFRVIRKPKPELPPKSEERPVQLPPESTEA